MTAQGQKGYALTDALIAAAIAAGVAVTAAQSLGVAARSAKSAKDLGTVISEAETINARIDAGLEDHALLEGISGWEITRGDITLAMDDGAMRDTEPRLLILSHQQAPRFSFERLVIEKANR